MNENKNEILSGTFTFSKAAKFITHFNQFSQLRV